MTSRPRSPPRAGAGVLGTAHPWQRVTFTTYALSLSFFEADHLDGDVDMIAVLRALLAENLTRSPGDEIIFRPDHGHRMLDDLAETKRTNPGYTAIGRLRGLAELRGAIRAIEHAG